MFYLKVKQIKKTREKMKSIRMIFGDFFKSKFEINFIISLTLSNFKKKVNSILTNHMKYKIKRLKIYFYF